MLKNYEPSFYTISNARLANLFFENQVVSYVIPSGEPEPIICMWSYEIETKGTGYCT